MDNFLNTIQPHIIFIGFIVLCIVGSNKNFLKQSWDNISKNWSGAAEWWSKQGVNDSEAYVKYWQRPMRFILVIVIIIYILFLFGIFSQ